MHDIQDKLHARIVRLSVLTLVVAGFTLWNLFTDWKQIPNIASLDGLFFLLKANIPALSVAVMVCAVLWILTQSTSDMNRVKHLAFIDELTGLPNRRQFVAELDSQLVHRLRDKKQIAILYFDLDRFKIINDCHGHDAGDAVIKCFGERISGVIRDGDMVARLSGDEFAAIVTNVESNEDLEKVAERVIQAMRKPIHYQDKNLFVGVSIGAFMTDDGSVDSVEAMRRADFAMLDAKDSGRNKWSIFCPGMADEIRSKSAMEADLRQAIERQELELRYHPLVNQLDGMIMGVEALVRWNHPQRGSVSPEVFIPLAEEIGIIDQLGEFVLRRACTDIKPVGDIKLAVNVSPMQFLQDNFAEMLQDVLLETGFDPRRLELEITEGVLISTPDATAEVLSRLRLLGVKIALDDFGTGFSSMSYLRDYPLDRIKIDRSFIEGINDEDNSYDFVSKMIELGSSLGMKVTVEGIETEQQLQMMRESECTELQGFLFSKPLTANELLESDLVKLAKETQDADSSVLQSAPTKLAS